MENCCYCGIELYSGAVYLSAEEIFCSDECLVMFLDDLNQLYWDDGITAQEMRG